MSICWSATRPEAPAARGGHEIIDALAAAFGRKVVLLEESGLRNPFLRAHIERDRRQLYPPP